MAAEPGKERFSVSAWLSRETELDSIAFRLVDEPTSGISAWARTTSGIVALLLFVQFASGILLAFHYVPATSAAYTTVAYIELAVRDGAWIRSMHYHSSILLPIALAIHLLQMIVRSSFRKNKTAWIFGLAMLGLVIGAAGTGYILPWDARSINGVNIGSSLMGNLPVIGSTAKAWLISGSAISTLTLSRFYGLHVYVVPAIILTAVVARLFIFGKQSQADIDGRLAAFARSQFVRNTVVAGLAFLGLAVFAAYFPAPFGPQAAESATYLPRPGPQFLWLFEMQKYTDGPVAALLAVGFPALAICGLISLALFKKGNVGLLRAAASGIFAVVFGTITVLTCVAIYQDREPRIADQLAKQEVDEAKFRASAFEPQIQAAPPAAKKETQATSNKDIAPELASVSESLPVPACYPKNCAKCHGANGEGTSKFPELAGVTTREDDQLTPELVLAIIDDPKTVGRSSKMPAYKTKLSDLDKQELVTWIKSLSPKPDAAAADEPVQTAKVGDKQQ